MGAKVSLFIFPTSVGMVPGFLKIVRILQTQNYLRNSQELGSNGVIGTYNGTFLIV